MFRGERSQGHSVRRGTRICTSEALRARKIGEGLHRMPEGILDTAGDFAPCLGK